MFYSGISDEAGQAIDTQIRAHRELGWSHMELRMVDGTNLTALPEEKFEQICDKLAEGGMKVSSFGSAIANWARPITCDPQIDIDDLKQAIPRMQRLNTPFIRIMSYPNDPDNPLGDEEWRKETVKRIRVLARMAEDGGVILGHENCSGWGGQSAEHNNRLIEEVNSPALKVIYDTGNPVAHGLNAWEFYQGVKEHIVYVHIKDIKIVNGKHKYTFCGEGEGYVRETLKDLFMNGYDGGISIEPHLGAVIHAGETKVDADELYAIYTEYGRRLMKIVDDIQSS